MHEQGNRQGGRLGKGSIGELHKHRIASRRQTSSVSLQSTRTIKTPRALFGLFSGQDQGDSCTDMRSALRLFCGSLEGRGASLTGRKLPLEGVTNPNSCIFRGFPEPACVDSSRNLGQTTVPPICPRRDVQGYHAPSGRGDQQRRVTVHSKSARGDSMRSCEHSVLHPFWICTGKEKQGGRG